MSLHVNKNVYLKYNHTVKYVNIIKLNFEIKTMIENEIVKEYTST